MIPWNYLLSVAHADRSGCGWSSKLCHLILTPELSSLDQSLIQESQSKRCWDKFLLPWKFRIRTSPSDDVELLSRVRAGEWAEGWGKPATQGPTGGRRSLRDGRKGPPSCFSPYVVLLCSLTEVVCVGLQSNCLDVNQLKWVCNFFFLALFFQPDILWLKHRVYGIDLTEHVLSVMFCNWFSCRKDLPSFHWMCDIRMLKM